MTTKLAFRTPVGAVSMKVTIKSLVTLALALLLNLGIATLANAQSLSQDAVTPNTFDCTCAIVGKNLLSNPSFETIGPKGSPVTFNGNFNGDSAAANWTVFINNQNGSGTITTELVPSTFGGGGGGAKMIHVTTNTQNGSGGIEQVQFNKTTNLQQTVASAWIFVKKGKVGIGTGNTNPGGTTAIDTTSLTTNSWERLQAKNGVSPVNQFIIYSVSGIADFYVDNTCVTAVPGITVRPLPL